ncbi:MAG: hypothetical protein WBE72_21055 [Terracidiphilus sp.]
MSDADQKGTGANAGGANAPDEIVSKYEVVPYAEIAKEDDLYSFRAALDTPQPAQAAKPAQQTQLPQQPQPQQPQQPLALNRKNLLLIGGAVLGFTVLMVVLLVALNSSKTESAPSFIDLGTGNIASAGLGARLIAKWDGKAGYELHIDALSPQQIPGFSAVAGNPPRPLSVNLRMKDLSGSVLCQKEILLPFDPGAAANPDQAQPLVPGKTLDGDTVENVAGDDGQIDEIVVNGQLLCPVKLYKRLVSWDFSSNFPALAEQEEWMRHELSVEADLRRKAAQARARALIPRVAPLPAPIDGDDVIVSDNPSRGTVTTSAGRQFYIGRGGLRSTAPGWQVFPASIHFHCNTRAICTLTRPDASTALQARLMH